MAEVTVVASGGINLPYINVPDEASVSFSEKVVETVPCM